MTEYNAFSFEDIGHPVTPEEAMHGLIAAIILRGVLDYRTALLNNVCNNDQDNYYICQSDQINSLETFFDNIGFNLYKTLPDKMIEFKKQMNKLTNDDFEPENETSYICPICGGIVNCKKVKLAPQHSQNGKKPYENKVFCRGCMMTAVVM